MKPKPQWNHKKKTIFTRGENKEKKLKNRLKPSIWQMEREFEYWNWEKQKWDWVAFLSLSRWKDTRLNTLTTITKRVELDDSEMQNGSGSEEMSTNYSKPFK
jgi:hypothetical protein